MSTFVAESKNSKKNMLFLLHNLIMFALTFGIGMLPPPQTGSITELGMDVLGIFVGALWLDLHRFYLALIIYYACFRHDQLFHDHRRFFSRLWGQLRADDFFYVRFCENIGSMRSDRLSDQLVHEPQDLYGTALGIHLDLFSRHDLSLWCDQYVRRHRHPLVRYVSFV